MKLCLDPGHGPLVGIGAGSGGAAVGPFIEHAMVWQVAVSLAKRVPDSFLARGQSEKPGLSARAARASNAHCTHAILLHFNAGGGKRSELWSTAPSVSAWFAGGIAPDLGAVTAEHGRHTKILNASTDANQRPANCLKPYATRGIDAVLVEICYLDDQPAAEWCTSDDGLASVVNCLADWCKAVVK